MAVGLAIDIADLRKTYRTRRGKVEALRGLDLQVRAGEIYGFIGINGAGKSTCIKSLLGLVRPAGGTIQIFGLQAGTMAARRKVGYLPEVATYHEFATADELLHFHAELSNVPRAQQNGRCAEALEAVNLTSRRSSRISEFSKGMKQRFGIAQALVADPPLLVLDELTSGLDPFAQRELREVLFRLRGRGVTVFFSSHYMAEIETICDRVGIIHRGKLRAEGTLEELLQDPGQMQVELSEPGRDAALLETWGFRSERSDHWTTRVPVDRVNQCLSEFLASGATLRRVEREKSSLEDYFHRLTLKVDQAEGVIS